ncbi:hypothetical protein CTAYLR_002955 [Chrysophaeum taylorii]|uniref:Aldehyde dehydrogenase domain-containing protein n=1 Tax=Chrysophaeum taylorii TaxID=2483200 RepID=A0AAD7XJE9_9STRA|nr:hypothetical protein CTAYLR_002955 [Chrysophaeum taylorii]
MVHVEGKVGRLAARSLSWAANKEERVPAAKALLESLKHEEWDKGWLDSHVALETHFNDEDQSSKAIDYASQARYYMGSTIQTFVETVVRAAEGGEMETWLPGLKGVTFEVVRGQGDATPFAEGAGPGKVCVVLGAGNQNFLTAVDALNRIFVNGECVLIKHHPLRPWLMEPYKKMFAPLIELDVLDQVLDEDFDRKVLADPRVGHVHLTGSEATFAAVKKSVGPGTTVSGELGCVTPWIALPGAWTSKELQTAARMLVAAKKANGGANCISPQVLVMTRGWGQRDEFIAEIRASLTAIPDAKAYYPGARERRDDFLRRYGVERADDDDAVALVEILHEEDDYALQHEVFGPFLAVVDVEDPVAFVNSKVKGSLTCTVLAPQVSGDPADVLEALNYGTVAQNTWSVFGYPAMCRGGTWGAHPPGDSSGRGTLGNHFGIEPFLDKTIVYAGDLAKPPVDFATPVPAIVYDALFVATLRTGGFAATRVAALLFRRLLSTIPGLFGYKRTPADLS